MTTPTFTKKSLALRLVPLALAMAVAVGAPAAARANYSFQSGSACMPARADASKVNYNNQSGIFNDSTSAANVLCPVIFDEHQIDVTPWEILVQVVDQHPTADVKCKLLGISASGSIDFEGQERKTSGASSSAKSLRWQSFEGMSSYLTYHLTCSLPAASSGKQSRVASFGARHLD
jgi:hypothetical protein